MAQKTKDDAKKLDELLAKGVTELEGLKATEKSTKALFDKWKQTK